MPHHAPLEIAGNEDDKQHAGQQLEQGEEAHQCRGFGEELGQVDAQEIRPGGTAAVGGDLGGFHQDHAESLRKDNELYPACRGGLRIEEAAAPLSIAEFEAHADKEANT